MNTLNFDRLVASEALAREPEEIAVPTPLLDLFHLMGELSGAYPAELMTQRRGQLMVNAARIREQMEREAEQAKQFLDVDTEKAESMVRDAIRDRRPFWSEIDAEPLSLPSSEEISTHWGVSDEYKRSQPSHNDLYL